MRGFRTKRRRYLWALGTFVVLLVGARVALPYFVKDEVNRRLMALESYDGHVEDVDLALWRGAYRRGRHPHRQDREPAAGTLLRCRTHRFLGRVAQPAARPAGGGVRDVRAEPEPGAVGIQVAVAARHGGELGGPARAAVPVPLQHDRRPRRRRDLPCAGDRLEGRARSVQHRRPDHQHDERRQGRPGNLFGVLRDGHACSTRERRRWPGARTRSRARRPST